MIFSYKKKKRLEAFKVHTITVVELPSSAALCILLLSKISETRRKEKKIHTAGLELEFKGGKVETFTTAVLVGSFLVGLLLEVGELTSVVGAVDLPCKIASIEKPLLLRNLSSL